MITQLRHNQVVTRKPHKCFYCIRIFPEKTVMTNWACVGDNSVYSAYNCLTCEQIVNREKFSDYDEGFPEGLVKEMLEKGQTPEGLLSKIIEEECLNSEKIKKNQLKLV